MACLLSGFSWCLVRRTVADFLTIVVVVVVVAIKMQLWAEKRQIPGQFFSSVARSLVLSNKLKKHNWLRKVTRNSRTQLRYILYLKE